MSNNNSQMKLLLMLQLFGVFSAFALGGGSNIKLASANKQGELIDDHSDGGQIQVPSMSQANLQEERLNPPNISLGIVNGYDAKLGEFPFYVSVGRLDESGKFVFYCGGTILSPSIILTAAHCTYDKSTHRSLSLAVQPTLKFPGPREEAKWIPVSKACKHKDHKPEPYLFNDVAILRLERSIKFSKRVHSARRPKAELPYGSRAVTIGLGFDDTYRLTSPKMLQVLPVERVHCLASHNSTLCIKSNHHNHVGSICMGDSGGPLVGKENGKQTVFGVNSHLIGDSLCRAGWPTGSADVFKLRHDIDELISKCSE